MAYGTVLASFNVEDFGTERVASLTMEEIAQRLRTSSGSPASRRGADQSD